MEVNLCFCWTVPPVFIFGSSAMDLCLSYEIISFGFVYSMNSVRDKNEVKLYYAIGLSSKFLIRTFLTVIFLFLDGINFLYLC